MDAITIPGAGSGYGRSPTPAASPRRQTGTATPCDVYAPDVCRMAAPVNHAQNSTNLRDRRQQADGDIATAFIKTFQDLRRPDTNGAKRIGKAKIGQRIHQYNWREYFAPQTTLLHGVMADGPPAEPASGGHYPSSPANIFILCRQPFGFCRGIIQ